MRFKKQKKFTLGWLPQQPNNTPNKIERYSAPVRVNGLREEILLRILIIAYAVLSSAVIALFIMKIITGGCYAIIVLSTTFGVIVVSLLLNTRIRTKKRTNEKTANITK